MPKITKGWPQKRRAKQAEKCRITKPWEHSTGPKTEKGKKTTKNNAIKHSLRSKEGKELIKLMRIQRDFVKYSNLFYKEPAARVEMHYKEGNNSPKLATISNTK